MNESDNDKRSDLINIFRILLKRKWMIIIGTAFFTVMAVIITLLLPKVYKSKAVISLSTIKKSEQLEPPTGMEIPIYRKYSNTFRNIGLFKEYIKIKENKEEWDLDENFFNLYIKPLYAFEFGRPGVRTTENSIFGIEIELLGDTPKSAKNKTEFLGDYILTTILNMQVGNFFELISIRSQSDIVQLNKTIIALDIETRHLKDKEALFENQLMKLPGLAGKSDREVVNVNENTEKYLSPQQQLVAVKVSIKDNQIQIDRHQRKVRINKLLLSYIEKTSHLFQQNLKYLVNDKLLELLIKAKNEFFSGEKDEESKLASYILSEQIYYFQKLQGNIYKFISGPILPEKHYKPKRKRIVIATFFLAFFVFVFLAFFMEAWENNR